MPLASRQFLKTILRFWARVLPAVEVYHVRSFQIDVENLDSEGHVDSDQIRAEFDALSRFIPIMFPGDV